MNINKVDILFQVFPYSKSQEGDTNPVNYLFQSLFVENKVNWQSLHNLEVETVGSDLSLSWASLCESDLSLKLSWDQNTSGSSWDWVISQRPFMKSALEYRYTDKDMYA